MEQRRPRQRLRAPGSPPPKRHSWKFFMAIFTSFNPKTLYISTFSHVAASSTSTPSSPSQSWPSGWHSLAGAGDGSKGDPQVDPPPTHTHTHTDALTRPNTPSITGFRHKSKSGRRLQEEGGDELEEGGDAVEMQKSGTGYRNKSDLKLKHTLLLYLINQTYGTILSALHFDRGQMNNRVCKYGKGSPYFLAQSGKR